MMYVYKCSNQRFYIFNRDKHCNNKPISKKNDNNNLVLNLSLKTYLYDKFVPTIDQNLLMVNDFNILRTCSNYVDIKNIKLLFFQHH